MNMANHTPLTDEQSTEAAIVKAGKTAPRVTPADIDAAIVGEFFFTAADAARFGYLTEDILDHDARDRRNAVLFSMTTRSYSGACIDIDANADISQPLTLLTFCVLVLRNGFTVTGESACASPENFDAQIGRDIARKNAREKIWPLAGYALKEQLFQMTQPPLSPEVFDDTANAHQRLHGSK
jgi:hypothetical protein